MNALVIAQPKQAMPSADLNLGGTSTSERVYITSATTSANNPTASDPIVLPLPTGGQLAGTAASSGTFNAGTQVYNAAFTTGDQGAQRRAVKFRVLAFGRVVTGTTSNFTVRIMYGVSGTVASNTAIATSGAVSLASLTTHWFMEAFLIYDAPSQRLDGYFSGQLHATTVSPTTLSNPITSVSLTGGATLGFVVTGTFATGNASNTSFLDGFYLILD